MAGAGASTFSRKSSIQTFLSPTDEKKFKGVSKNPENYGSKNINNIKICVDRNTVEKEFQAVKILLETGEFDNEMDIDEKKSNEASKNQENEKSRNINNIKMFIQKNENEQTPLKYSSLYARNNYKEKAYANVVLFVHFHSSE